MGVASKTFENHLGRALREMRVALRQYDEVS